MRSFFSKLKNDSATVSPQQLPRIQVIGAAEVLLVVTAILATLSAMYDVWFSTQGGHHQRV